MEKGLYFYLTKKGKKKQNRGGKEMKPKILTATMVYP